MLRRGTVLLVSVFLLLATVAVAADPPLGTAHGEIDKVSKGSITIRPRDEKGRFEKALVLKLTGTSKVTTLVPQMRAGKLVVTQQDADAKDLKAKQPIAVIYTTLKEGPVLLSAVVQRPAAK
jgi:hypothetical protein